MIAIGNPEASITRKERARIDTMGGCSRSATPGVGLARGARLSTRRTLARHALPQRRHLYRPLERNLDSRSAPRSLRAIPPVLEWVQTQALNGPPHYYFLYLLSAGCGVPVSEDALVCWIGSNLALNKYGSVLKNLVVLVWVYFGVVLSDMITFYIGVAANRGLLRRFFPNWGTSKNGVRAKREVERFGSKIGFVQRFFIGFRGPLCLCSGIAGAKPSSFFLGTCAGALLSISCQVSLLLLLLAVVLASDLALLLLLSFWWDPCSGTPGRTPTSRPSRWWRCPL